MRIKKPYYIFFVIFLCGTFSALAQVERRLSLHATGGIALYSTAELRNAADLPERVFGAFKPGLYAGAGFNYRIWKSFYLTETWTFQQASKQNYKLQAKTFHTGLRYNFFDKKRLNPYIGAFYNLAYVNLERKENTRVVNPNNFEAIGNGYFVSSIEYRENALTLKNMLMHGFGATVGLEYGFRKLKNKLSIFSEYSIQANIAKNNNTFNQDYFYNTATFAYQTATIGLRYHIYRPQKQLLATLKRDDWRNDKPVDVKGTLIYKNGKKYYEKSLEVELDDTLENPVSIIQSDDKGLIFLAKDVQLGDYKFMFAKKKRRIVRADLQILNYNQIEIADEELELEMFEMEMSENLLSRDANFSVLLREGFQHEITLSTTAENIMGQLNTRDSRCRVRIYLKDLKDSVISYIDTLAEGNTFNFVDIAPGQYKMQFVRMDDNCEETDFSYQFTGAAPNISKQFNTNEPEDTTPTFSVDGRVALEKKTGAPKGTVVKLIASDGRVEKSMPPDQKGEYKFDDLKSTTYNVVYEDPSDKAKLNYTVKDRKSNPLKTVQYGSGKKPSSGPVMVKGKVVTPKSDDVSKITVMLIDSNGKIRQKLPLATDGTFGFQNLSANKYKVVYESNDPFIRGNLKYRVEDPNLKISKLNLPDMKATAEIFDTIHVTKTGEVVRTDTLSKNNKTVTNKKKEIIPVTAFKDFKPSSTYTLEGIEVHPVGYGLQIASFFVYTNLESFCKRVKAKGEKNVYIQVLQKDKNNPMAGNIYRVIIGATEDKDKILKQVPAYIDKGYDPVLRKHL